MESFNITIGQVFKNIDSRRNSIVEVEAINEKGVIVKNRRTNRRTTIRKSRLDPKAKLFVLLTDRQLAELIKGGQVTQEEPVANDPTQQTGTVAGSD